MCEEKRVVFALNPEREGLDMIAVATCGTAPTAIGG
jgi:hypothetical protein